MPDVVLTCATCERRARVLGVVDDFTHYEFWYLCPECVARVRAAGPWKIRRAKANQARVEALKERFPGLHVAETAPRRVALGGEIEGRPVSFTLKIAAREGESERYVLRVALRLPRSKIERADLAIDESLAVRLCTGSPSIIIDRCRWLRLGFRHLGKLDMLRVVEGMIATAERLDGPSQADAGTDQDGPVVDKGSP